MGPVYAPWAMLTLSLWSTVDASQPERPTDLVEQEVIVTVCDEIVAFSKRIHRVGQGKDLRRTISD
jgi:hypothetical protein